MRIKGDAETWTFVIKPEPGVTIDHQVWTYRSKDGSEPNWGTFTGGDGTNELTWASPNIADHFTINVKAKRHCAGTGEGPDDFELNWGGDVVSVIIKRDDVDITEPHDNPQEVKVGQIMHLKAEVQNKPANAKVSYQWTVPGIIVKDWKHNSTSSQVVPVDNLTEPTVDFAWVDGGNGRRVKLSVNIDGKAIPSVESTFNVTRPNYNIKITKTRSVHFVYSEEKPDFLRLEAAVRISKVNIPPNEQNNYEIWQMVNDWNPRFKIESFGQNNGWWHSNMMMTNDLRTLDTTDPYKKLPGITEYTTDGPGITFSLDYTAEVFIHNAFTDFLMYKPPGGDAIFVPIAKVSWNWTGHAKKSGGTYSDQWDEGDLIGQDTVNPVDAMGQSTMLFPGGEVGWNKNIKDKKPVQE